MAGNVCAGGVSVSSTLFLHSRGTKNAQAITRTRQAAQITHKKLVPCLIAEIKQMINITRNNIVKAVTPCFVTSKPINIRIATSIQKSGDSGSLEILKLISPGICQYYNSDLGSCQPNANRTNRKECNGIS